MIDWPNLIAGFLLGLVPTGLLWWADHSKQKENRRQEVLDSWRGLAKEIELLLYQPDTTSMTIYTARSRHPIDTWRAVLGPEPFRTLEELERAYATAENMPGLSPQLVFQTDNRPESAMDRQRRAVWENRTQVSMKFANMSRRMQDEAYQVVTEKERRQKLRADYLRHPFKTWNRERHNKRIRKQSPA